MESIGVDVSTVPRIVKKFEESGSVSKILCHKPTSAPEAH